MKLRHSLIFVLIFVFVAGFAFAQEAKMPPTYIGAQIFFEWAQNMTDEGDVAPADKKNTFRFTRIWFIAYKALDPVWSFYGIYAFEDSGGDSYMIADLSGDTLVYAKSTQRYRAWVFLSQIMAKKDLGMVVAMLKFGLISDPIICSTGSNTWCDIRWLRDNLLYGTNPYAGGIDVSIATDLGVGVELEIMKKMIMVDAQVVNGEGFLYTTESKDIDKLANTDEEHGKAYQARVTLTLPFLTALHFSGYYRLQENSAAGQDFNDGYYAGSIWYRDKLINAGVYYIVPFWTYDGDPVQNAQGKDRNVTIIDSYINIYLDSLINIPITIIATYGVGEDADADDTKKTYTGIGISYTFAKLVRLGLWYQIQTDEKVDAAGGEDNKQFFVKSELYW